jgi:hypothetical protein
MRGRARKLRQCMTEPIVVLNPVDASVRLPESPICAECGLALTEPYGWCSNCRAAYCFPCGRQHFCTPSCPANGCMAGLCVREVKGGVLSPAWGLPPSRIAHPAHVEGVAQAVAEEVEGHDRGDDGEAGEDADPPGLTNEVAALVDGEAPGRR